MTPDNKDDRKRQRTANLLTALGALVSLAVAGVGFYAFIRHENKMAAACEVAGGTYLSRGYGECWNEPNGTRIFNF
jgi:hypothetical protein